MLRLTKYINKKLSVRLSLMVVSSMAILLAVSLTVMLYYSRKSVKEESFKKASQTLEATMQRVDNILLSVEQACGNTYFNLPSHLDSPDMLASFCRELVEANPYVTGCAIALRPYFYQGSEACLFYARRQADGSVSATKNPENLTSKDYTEKEWYAGPLKSVMPEWQTPQEGNSGGISGNNSQGHVMTFSLPLTDKDGNLAGVLAADLSLNRLADIVQEEKPSDKSFCIILSPDGSLIVHPDSAVLLKNTQTVKIKKLDPKLLDVADEMMKGEASHREFKYKGEDYIVMYRPFNRTVVQGRSFNKLGWSAGIVYPIDDVMGDYVRLLHYVIGIAVLGLLMLLILSQKIIHRQLLPLRLLTTSAQHIAEGHFDVQVPVNVHHDEIGRLQNDFRQMQKSLSTHMNELEQLTATLQQRGEELRHAYDQARKADRMKTAFLHHMTNQMVDPSQAIFNAVKELCEPDHPLTREEILAKSKNIRIQGDAITELLNNLLNVSDEEKGKEVVDVI